MFLYTRYCKDFEMLHIHTLTFCIACSLHALKDLKEFLYFLALMVASKRVPFNWKFMVTNHVQQLESTIIHFYRCYL